MPAPVYLGLAQITGWVSKCHKIVIFDSFWTLKMCHFGTRKWGLDVLFSDVPCISGGFGRTENGPSKTCILGVQNGQKTVFSWIFCENPSIILI